LADDEVVEQLDIEQLAGRDDLNGEGHIGGRGGRVARWVVVDGDNVGSLLAHRVAEDFSFASSTCVSQASPTGQWSRTADAESEDFFGPRIGRRSASRERLTKPTAKAVVMGILGEHLIGGALPQSRRDADASRTHQPDRVGAIWYASATL
jgi:hypothetical protein